MFHPKWRGVRGLKLRFDCLNVSDEVYQLRNGTGLGISASQYGHRRTFLRALSVLFEPGGTCHEMPGTESSRVKSADRRPRRLWAHPGYGPAMRYNPSWPVMWPPRRGSRPQPEARVGELDLRPLSSSSESSGYRAGLGLHRSRCLRSRRSTAAALSNRSPRPRQVQPDPQPKQDQNDRTNPIPRRWWS